MQVKARFKVILAEAKRCNGLTLVELMVALAIASVVLALIYAAYDAQLRSHVTQQAVVDIQQSLRSSMYYVQRSIRMAGRGNGGSFVDNFAGFPGYSSGDVTRDAMNIAFTMDDDGDGCIDGSPGCSTDNVDNELIAYRFDPATNTLQKFSPKDFKDALPNPWHVIAENIQSINFVYLNEAMAATAVAADIRSVQVTITAEPVQQVYVRAAPKSPQSLSAHIYCRNL